ncbi:hypothetical protein KsCSTR_05940 [Candidatus Kuenenia stuttgartiensis]|uniref:Uncharacterized protein n=1 Tax=Kuenenia stuttgartiensis TaxID=174633 RepID=Q1PZY7_KUEST|nr:hypothetical protein KsCSTR_05940 [Candidatus Kuenenia stuttgartiensis]CAJ72647.1 unknown protein [Candidatus Kuenenia stuttgartiensis]
MGWGIRVKLRNQQSPVNPYVCCICHVPRWRGCRAAGLEGAFPIVCKRSWSRGKTTLTGFENPVRVNTTATFH